jgi:hypothetical protein
MPPPAIGILSLVEELVQQSPEIYSELQNIFSKTTYTPADWEALKRKIAQDTFTFLAPDVQLQTPAQKASSGTAN